MRRPDPRRLDPRRFDPLAIAFVLALLWAALVVRAIAGELGETQGSTAASLAAAPAGVRAGPPPDAEPIAVTIEPGADAETIAARLVSEGVLPDGARFRALLALTGAGPELRAGRYEFAPGLPAAEVVRLLRTGPVVARVLVVFEGQRAEEIGRQAADLGIATPEEWAAALARPRTHPILRSRPPGASLNGYLFPARYPFGDDTTADGLVAAMLQALGDALDPADEAAVAASGYTLHEVLTVASIVEREAVLPEEYPVIASVFLNRLERGIKLDADPTVQYAIAAGASGPAEAPAAGWWKAPLTLEDLAFESPWNTYLRAGLPPGPIASPGIAAIRAVLRPAETGYFYFVARGDGSHAFAETLAQHNANVAEFIGP